ncbi:MAG: glycosyltransferase family 39 protein [Chloroflexi bacterium]|nr:glycosyltransferase family 39 protein [Chloroflexota bacterium]
MRASRSRILSLLRGHRHLLVIVTLLTLVMTFPTILYVFRTEVFWLPVGQDGDALTEIWDTWYGKLFLSGQADRFFSDRIFYPRGVSLVYHPLNLPYIVVINALQTIMPVSNAFSLAYMLIIFSSTLAAYVYLRWLMEDKWIALLGAIVFGFSPHVIGHPNHPNNALVATLPLIIYGFHRGIHEDRGKWVIVAGLLTGVTSVINIYAYVCAVLSLGLMICAFAASHWRSRRFWQLVSFLIAAIVISSLWRIYPMMASSQSLDAALEWRGGGEVRTDLISFFVNHGNPFAGTLVSDVLQPAGYWLSSTSFLGYLPLVLIAVGLIWRRTRRPMLPWLALCIVFLVLRLGSFPRVNGIAYYDIQLPKHYLTEILPSVFRPFYEADNFQIGALLPLAVLTCYGLAALKSWRPIAGRAGFIILLVVVVASEYYIPVKNWIFAKGQFAFLDWLAEEEDSREIRLINLPLGRLNSKVYNLYQSLSGYPHAEGAVSRTPDSAFDYMRGNILLNAWHGQQPIHCEMVEQEAYRSGLAQLEEDGFSHIVFHHHDIIQDWEEIRESFHGIEPAFHNGFTSIYRLRDLHESCPGELSDRHRFTQDYADALQNSSLLAERHGLVLVFPPTTRVNDHFLRFLRHFAEIDRTIVTLSMDEQAKISIQSSTAPAGEATLDLEEYSALWLLNGKLEFAAEQSEAYQGWFSERFRFCARFAEDERTTIDLYLRADTPCAAMDDSSVIDVVYDSGLQLHNASYEISVEKMRFFFAWTNDTGNVYSFSIQFFDEAGNKALQADHVLRRDLLSVHELDIEPLPPGAYSVQVIVYDFESGISQGGTVGATGARIERELEIARIEA